MAAEVLVAPLAGAFRDFRRRSLEEADQPAALQKAHSIELTAADLVRLNQQQGPHVEDDDASAAHEEPSPLSPASEQKQAPALATALPSEPSGAAKPKSKALGRRLPMGSSRSLPALPTTSESPSPPLRRCRVLSSASEPVSGDEGNAGSEKLEQTRLPHIEPQSPQRRPRHNLMQQPQRSPQRGDARRCVSEGLLQEDLRSLPVAEALRQILIERTGSLKQAYKAMDINGGGVVNLTEFERGLQRAHVFGSPLIGYRDTGDLFKGIDQSRDGVVSLQDLLGYVPIKYTRSRDTKAQWILYNNKTSALKSRLARPPRWKVDRRTTTGEEPELMQRQRRELRVQLLDARQRGNLKMEEKRNLVKGLVADEERDGEWQHYYRKMNEQKERIDNAIHSCSRARSELVALQQAMVQLTPKTRRPKLTCSLSLPALNLGIKVVKETPVG